MSMDVYVRVLNKDVRDVNSTEWMQERQTESQSLKSAFICVSCCASGVQ